ncbi:DEKNAAC103770 [Brettanomyces naardenensis]|uniref:DEKNAAC103770 n=1 Tax=Brettanomyces naardenensis TaxID=13370 RepID=A0A448YP39_BRENA|nr:DEKNAAC103770 [Brettanomyces naardenensis]
MKYFITGASGLIGSAVTAELLSHGHSIIAIARSDKSAEELEKKGVEVIRGDLESLDALAAGASKADGVVHLAFVHDFSNFKKSIEVDRTAITTMLEALKGSDKPFIMVGGALVLASDGKTPADEDSPFIPLPPEMNRPENETFALGYAIPNHVRAMSIRLPPSVHGRADLHGFIPITVAGDRKYGSAVYLGEGKNKWPAVNVSDAATLIRLALEKGKAGRPYNAIGERGIEFRTIAEAIGKKYKLPVKSVNPEEATKVLGFLATFAGLGLEASSEKTKKELGWEVKGDGLLEDIKNYY